jgi:hypothetical protein
MPTNVRFLDQVTINSTSATSGEVTIYSASVDLGAANVLDFTGSGITSITNTSGYAIIDISGATGPSGSAGPSGSSGPEGNLAVWRYSTDTSITDPGAGYFRIDTTWSSNLTSKLSIDDISFSPTINLGSVLNEITPNSVLKIVSLTNPDVYKYLQITGINPLQSGYEIFDVTALASNGTPSDNDQFGVSIPAPAANAVAILDDNVTITTAVTSINFSGSAFTIIDEGSNAITVFGNLGDVFPYTGSADISGSSTIDGIFLVKLNDGNGDTNKFQVNNEGTVVLGKLNTTPTAVSGGMFYSASNEFYLGFS